MLVFGTEMELVTLIFLLLELPLFCFQLLYFLQRPQAHNRKWYLILLLLLVVYNTIGGLFPDPNISLPIILQNIIAYGSGFAMGAYFPFYFYKAFSLESLRFHALYGIFIFLIGPFLIFFVAVYGINGNLDFAIQYGIVVPFFYSVVLLTAIIRAISKKYKMQPDSYHFWEMIAVYCAVLPWATLTVFAYFSVGQFWEAILTNGGFVVISILFLTKDVKHSRKEFELIKSLNNQLQSGNVFEANCKYYGLTTREIEITELVRKGKRYRNIAELLFISEKTVGAHIQNIYMKMSVNNKTALIHKLSNPLNDHV